MKVIKLIIAVPHDSGLFRARGVILLMHISDKWGVILLISAHYIVTLIY